MQLTRKMVHNACLKQLQKKLDAPFGNHAQQPADIEARSAQYREKAILD